MGLRYTPEHEWLHQEADGSLTVGITRYAQEALGDLVFVQLPDLRAYALGEKAVVLESVKAASNIGMPLAGQVLAVNESMNDAPETVNADPLGAGWSFRFQPATTDAFAALLDEATYQQLIKG